VETTSETMTYHTDEDIQLGSSGPFHTNDTNVVVNAEERDGFDRSFDGQSLNSGVGYTE
jgi:hypothetical protein